MIFNPYLMALPYVTFVPLYAILEMMLENPKKTRTTELDNKQSNIKKKRSLIVQYIAGSILVLITGGWIFLMMIIAANQESNEKILWVIQFAQIVVQDLMISPFVTLLFQFGIFKLLKGINYRKNRKIAQILRKSLSHSFKTIYLSRKRIHLKINPKTISKKDFEVEESAMNF